MDHTCAVLSAPSAAVKCWGRGTFGALGYGDEESRGGVPQELGASTLIVPITTSADPVNSVYGSKDATCALLKSGAVKCWGIASNPVLAQPDLVASAGNIGDAPNEVGQLAAINLGSGVRARSLGIGDLHACALLDTGEVKCWGNNSNGQLGIGNTDTIGDAKSELGAALKAVPLQ
jgi:alpha-tubulin suppressor-like RCC1 family protein